ncbi:virulence factor [Ammoniphilus sp. YIM 78166]|uniref:virulence factor n=1 Tax=Ammoniphilus sp. YIM 78166 TaxID=1644106 RepID=UPI0010702D6D|nr:virulence factor [Ammoniphilus sp. YIM 78166]
MKILSIEPTPSPNVMKLNVDESLPIGVTRNFTKEKTENAPSYILQLLQLDGVQGVFQVSDFIALERHPKADWKDILARVNQLFGDPAAFSEEVKPSPAITFGEVHVSIQMFKGIPVQVKLTANAEEMRFGLPEQFGKAVLALQSHSPNLLLERKWVEQGSRYGTFKEIGEEVVAEIIAAYDPARIGELLDQAMGKEVKEQGKGAATDLLEHPDWEKRFAALSRINPSLEDLPMLAKALEDTKTSIRRLATVYLGMIGQPDVLPYLYKALKDKSASVRRTAGDALSDIGNPLAIRPMAEALHDPNKLVRWRAARFLFEVGDHTALDELKEAVHDPEFEVSLQARMAVERIERGEEASGTVWQQMTKASRKELD